MAHPVHAILKRFFDIEQFAFDAKAREFWPSARHEIWPSEHFVQAFVGGRPESGPQPRERGKIHRERESAS